MLRTRSLPAKGREDAARAALKGEKQIPHPAGKDAGIRDDRRSNRVDHAPWEWRSAWRFASWTFIWSPDLEIQGDYARYRATELDRGFAGQGFT